MYSTFLVSTSECITCNNQVLKTLGTLQGVFDAEMDSIDGRIVVSHTEEVTRKKIEDIIIKLGFAMREANEEQDNEIKTDEPSIWGCAL
jgi:cation transport ATPase